MRNALNCQPHRHSLLLILSPHSVHEPPDNFSTKVNVIEDMLFGTRFHLSDGSVRGRLCPGGTAGPLLRLTRLLRTISTASMFQRASRIFERRDKRYPENASASGHANDLNKLEVLAVRAHTDGSLNITLPPTSSVDHSRDSVDATTRRRAMTTPAPPALTEPSWVKRCGLAGYDH